MQPTGSTQLKLKLEWTDHAWPSSQFLNPLLGKWTFFTNLAQLKHRWTEPGRHYHGWDRAVRMLHRMEKSRGEIELRYAPYFPCFAEALALAILFHDIVYIPGSKRNEWVSKELFNACWNPSQEIGTFTAERVRQAVEAAIDATEYGTNGPWEFNTDPVAAWLQHLDLYELSHGTREQIQRNFINVYMEFARLCNYDPFLFETKQNEFLRDLAHRFNFAYTDTKWTDFLDPEDIALLRAEGRIEDVMLHRSSRKKEPLWTR